MMFLKSPERFSFKATVTSHGWCGLAPFSFDEKRGELFYVFGNAGEAPVVASAKEYRGGVKVRTAESVESATGRKIAAGFLRILAFDEDLSGLHEMLEGHSRLGWISESNAGRMLRSPSVFEDVVKTICTTNCSWALTKAMTSRLVEKLGRETASGNKAFPTPSAMASRDEKFYREEIRAGYRSDYIREFASLVAEGRLDPEDWLDPVIPSADLRKMLLEVKGVGPYAAESILKLLGRYDSLALDSFLRSEFYKRHNEGSKCEDKVIEKHYEEFGDWRGLVLWLEMCCG